MPRVSIFLTPFLSLVLDVSSQSSMQEMTANLKPGDLVLRSGRGIEAAAVQLASSGMMSHIGIVVRDTATGNLLVAHAEPSMATNSSGYLAAEPLSSFIDIEKASAYEIWRPRREMEIDTINMEQFSWRAIKHRVPFDSHFSMTDGSAYYCSEFVLLAYNAGHAKFRHKIVASTIPGFSEAVVMPEAIPRRESFFRVSIQSR